MELVCSIANKCKWFFWQFPVILMPGFAIFLIFGTKPANAQNPFVKSIYTADPSAHVWSDGRLYVYPSHDIAPPRGCDLMDRYHVFSTDDMVNWTDHGEILNSEQVAWGRPEGGFMWAPDCAYKDGIYYFYFPHPSDSEWNSSWKIGVATSTEPAANFTVQGYIEGLKSMIDPCVFVDDDGQAYLYYGGGSHCEGGKLNENMMEIDGQMQQMQGLVDFHEASWVHKRDGVYYLSYSDNNSTRGNQLRYAVSDNPLGPWTSKGVYMEPTGSSTNHGSIVEYKGQWYAFYHNSILSGNDWLRSICVDSLYYNAEGTIQLVQQTRTHGAAYHENPAQIPGTIEAEDFDEGGQGAAFSDSDETNNGEAYRQNEGVDIEASENGRFNIGWTNGGEWLEYTVDVAETANYNLDVVVASPNGNCSFHLKLDGKDITGSVKINSTGGWQNYQPVSATGLAMDKGTHIIQFFEETGGYNFDKMIFSKGWPTATVDLNEDGNKLTLFPNPASSVVRVVLPEANCTVQSIVIFDMQGRLIRQCAVPKAGSRSCNLDIHDLTPGTYLLNVVSERENYSGKLLIR